MDITVTLSFDHIQEAASFFLRASCPLDPAIGAAPAPTTGATPGVILTAKPEKPVKENPAAKDMIEAVSIDRATVSKAAVALAIKDKAKAVAILAEHDVKAVKDLPDDQLGAVHAKLVAAMGE